MGCGLRVEGCGLRVAGCVMWTYDTLHRYVVSYDTFLIRIYEAETT